MGNIITLDPLQKNIPAVEENSPLTIRRALISVSDKKGLIAFAGTLKEYGIEIISTGGTYAALHNAGIEVKQVSEVTGFPEILDGRVKTLHPKIHGGILAVNDNQHHRDQLNEHGIEPIDLVVVNLYPFEETIAKEDVKLDEAIEQIDIGGPSMVRAAAKNFRYTAVVVNPDVYGILLEEMREYNGAVTAQTRFQLACRAFQHTAHYDAAISSYLNEMTGQSELPDSITFSMAKEQPLRYGENPHQSAALYGSFGKHIQKLHGKELSFNNILDINAAVILCAEFAEPTAAIVKHNNPCGVASGSSLAEAYSKAFSTDKASAYGGIVCVNRPLDRATAEAINEIFTEVIIAPEYEPGVLELLTKKKDRRLMRLTSNIRTVRELDIRKVIGGVLVQDPDQHRIHPNDLKVVTKRKPTDEELQALLFAWRVAKHVKSNAIVYTTFRPDAGNRSGPDVARRFFENCSPESP